MTVSDVPVDCVIIGSVASGKTSLLGVLQLAAGQMPEERRAIRILPQSEDMGELIALTNSAVRSGRMPITATQGIKRYLFDCEVTDSSPGSFFRRTKKKRFSMLDSPGGAIFGSKTSWADRDVDQQVMQVAREEAIAQLKTAECIILCVDSNDENSASEFVQYLPEALREAAQDRLACRKLVICLTKADQYAIDRQQNLQEFAYEDPVARARRVVSRVGLNILKAYLPKDVEIRVGWASVYGFDPRSGRPNYDPEQQSFLIDGSVNATAAEMLERWHPYQVVDPFVFLTNGDSMNLQRLPTLEAHVEGLDQPEFFNALRPHSDRAASGFRRLWSWVAAFYNYVK